MTKTLILMRHAKSDWSTPGTGDKERPLNPRGRTAAPRMAQWLWGRGEWPDLVLCSSSIRTRQTWDLMQNAIKGMAQESPPSLVTSKSSGTQVNFMDSLYLATPEVLWSAFLDAAQNAPEMKSILLLAHNPGMEMLASQLRGEMQEMPTATISIFRVMVEASRSNAEPSPDFAHWVATQKPKELPN